jgi:ABC-type transporter Mla MlaB component
MMSLDFTTFNAPVEVVPALPTPLEQARRLQAAGQAQQACQTLDAALQGGFDFGTDAEAAWSLLLDLCQATAQRERFDELALEFARRFEKSPPAWRGGSTAAAAAPAGKLVSASLSGTLNARVEGPLQQVLKVCLRNPVRIDLARIVAADDHGCALLLAALDTCRKSRARCVLAGAGHLADLLAGMTQQGRRADEHAWLLLLHLYQRLGREAAFEDAALAYAVTFELSPPSWEPAHAGDCEN